MTTNLYTKDAGTLEYDQLIYDSSIDLEVEVVTVVSGAGALKRGSVLGLITASGKANLADKAATGGTAGLELAKYVLAEDVDATSGDVNTVAYSAGKFNVNSLIFKAANAIADHKDSLRAYGIYTAYANE